LQLEPINWGIFGSRLQTCSRFSWINNKNMKAFNLVNPQWAISEIDVVIGSPVDYKKAHKNVTRIKLQDATIPVVSMDDLIKMKKITRREQDDIDIKYLRKLNNEKA
jgi:hypothetical protein